MHIFDLPYQENSSIWFDKFASSRTPIFLDSCFQANNHLNDFNRYDLICWDPFIEIIQKGFKTLIIKDGTSFLSDESFAEIVDVIYSGLLDSYENNSLLPFTGGLIGYLSYEFGQKSTKDTVLPHARANAYKNTILVDHLEKKTYFISFDKKRDAELIYDQCLNHQKEIIDEFVITEPIVNIESFEDYKRKFNKIQQYIIDGDVYQVNLATKFSTKYSGDPWVFYKKFREINKSPYMAYLKFEDYAIISGSPEQFISVNGSTITSRPIKGTMPRGDDPKTDCDNYEKLSSSEKDKAENLMIVDLIRNDLGKNCDTGSVNVKKLFTIESYPNVHHLVSSIEGQLKKEISPWTAFCDSFPGGSITGAPKKRSIEIISELESFSREVYCGSIFYLSFNKTLNSNIAIRSLIAYDEKLEYFSGGGITKSSTVKSEYNEIFNKAANIEKAISYFRR
ncbi:MAG: aminodeoxychorismate synthase component I [Betaproteobacteria bacterium]|jgi:para-aminobenzoate synthetase component I|nr:aminodeoxychorismate synthase component I [Nitrosomonadales bacterium]NCV53394.1 aminodeoxychorismate synthase component I [Betaproteobacteria bacterium]NCX67602.1 aminodeoxychorismate synthase component I [Betaproteobacteria bacterium]